MATNLNEIASRRLLTVEEYQRMGETGILKEEDRVELIEGQIIDLSPISSKHNGIVMYLNNQFASALSGKCIVEVQGPLVLNDNSQPQPDLALLKPREDYYQNAHPLPEDTFLIVEVADTSLRFDREIKIPLYARHNIPEVWLIDTENQTLTVYQSPSNGQYKSEQIADTAKPLNIQAFPAIALDLSKMFTR